MKTKKLDIKNDTENNIEQAAQILKSGGIVAIPTETVYGLAASAYSDEAIKKVFNAKGRPQDNPLIVHISRLEQLYDVAREIPQAAYLLADKFWPGPLTMVLKKNDSVCSSVSCGMDTVAVRMPSDEIARSVIDACGLPLAAPSANLSGYPSPTTALHVVNDLDGLIDAVLMGEDCKVGVESTVISIVSEPRLLRPGAVTAEQLRQILPNLIIDKAILEGVSKDEKVESPGMKYKHYSPNTNVFLVEGNAAEFAEYVNKTYNSVAICFKSDTGILIESVIYGRKNDEKTLAHSIFGILRDIDNKNYSAAYIHAPGKIGVGLAVYNRLIRAAAFKVIKL